MTSREHAFALVLKFYPLQGLGSLNELVLELHRFVGEMQNDAPDGRNDTTLTETAWMSLVILEGCARDIQDAIGKYNDARARAVNVLRPEVKVSEVKTLAWDEL